MRVVYTDAQASQMIRQGLEMPRKRSLVCLAVCLAVHHARIELRFAKPVCHLDSQLSNQSIERVSFAVPDNCAILTVVDEAEVSKQVRDSGRNEGREERRRAGYPAVFLLSFRLQRVHLSEDIRW